MVFGDFLAEASDIGNSTDDASVQGSKLVSNCGGDAGFENKLDSVTLLGVVELSFNNFNDCNRSIINGEFVITVEEVDQISKDVLKGSFEFNETNISSSVSNMQFYGKVSIFTDKQQNTDTFYTEYFEVVDNSDKKQYLFKDFTEISSNKGIRYINYSGKVYISDHGYVDITTTRQLLCMENEKLDCEIDRLKLGEIILLGENNSKATIKYLEQSQPGYTNVIALDLDANGDGVYEFAKIIDFTKIINSDNLVPFAYAGKDIEVLFDETHEIILSAKASFDVEGENLVYSWSAKAIGPYLNSSCIFPDILGGSNDSLLMGVTDQPTLNVSVSEYGDYCFTVTVSDGTERNSYYKYGEDSIAVRFKKIDLFETHVSELYSPNRRYGNRGGKELVLIDINKDMLTDVILMQGDDRKAHKYLQNSQHQFEYAGIVPLDITSIESDAKSPWISADLNKDGLLDIIGIHRIENNKNAIDYFLQLTDGTFSKSQRVYPDISNYDADDIIIRASLEISDLDNNSYPDIVLVGVNYIKLFLQDENGFSAPIVYGAKTASLDSDFLTLDADYLNDVVFTDIDGDGDIEVITLHSTINKIRVYKLLDGILVLQDEIQTISQNNSAFGVYDTDGDGESEFYIVGRDKSYDNLILTIYRKNADQVTSQSIPLSGSFSAQAYNNRIHFTDFNNDGKSDIELTVNSDNSMLLLQGSNNEFSSAIRIPHIDKKAIIIDMNNDAKPDVVNFGIDSLTLRLNKFQ